MVGLKGFEASYPHELSGGMLKRAELARAFVVKPDILYMDEPFSALDALMNLRMRNELLRILDEERHTVLLITHDVEEAVLHGRSHHGAVPPAGHDPGELRRRPPRPRRLSSPQAQALREAILKELGV
jgi:ABC-type nitrate/sulfonate/bicarbonate transport system ATPase subunit